MKEDLVVTVAKVMEEAVFGTAQKRFYYFEQRFPRNEAWNYAPQFYEAHCLLSWIVR